MTAAEREALGRKLLWRVHQAPASQQGEELVRILEEAVQKDRAARETYHGREGGTTEGA